jgi:hypothetical protein
MVISLFCVGSEGDIVEAGRQRNNCNAAILDRDADSGFAKPEEVLLESCR